MEGVSNEGRSPGDRTFPVGSGQPRVRRHAAGGPSASTPSSEKQGRKLSLHLHSTPRRLQTETECLSNVKGTNKG